MFNSEDEEDTLYEQGEVEQRSNRIICGFSSSDDEEEDDDEHDDNGNDSSRSEIEDNVIWDDEEDLAFSQNGKQMDIESLLRLPPAPSGLAVGGHSLTISLNVSDVPDESTSRASSASMAQQVNDTCKVPVVPRNRKIRKKTKRLSLNQYLLLNRLWTLQMQTLLTRARFRSLICDHEELQAMLLSVIPPSLAGSVRDVLLPFSSSSSSSPPPSPISSSSSVSELKSLLDWTMKNLFIGLTVAQSKNRTKPFKLSELDHLSTRCTNPIAQTTEAVQCVVSQILRFLRLRLTRQQGVGMSEAASCDDLDDSHRDEEGVTKESLNSPEINARVSADYNALVMVAVCRSLGLETRLVTVLQPIFHKVNGAARNKVRTESVKARSWSLVREELSRRCDCGRRALCNREYSTVISSSALSYSSSTSKRKHDQVEIPESDKCEWACVKCTFLNAPSSSECEICLAKYSPASASSTKQSTPHLRKKTKTKSFSDSASGVKKDTKEPTHQMESSTVSSSKEFPHSCMSTSVSSLSNNKRVRQSMTDSSSLLAAKRHKFIPPSSSGSSKKKCKTRRVSSPQSKERKIEQEWKNKDILSSDAQFVPQSWFCWPEIYSNTAQRWLSVDCMSGIVDSPKHLHFSDPQARYIVAVWSPASQESSSSQDTRSLGFAKDVTERYAKKWSTQIKARKSFSDLWSAILTKFNQGVPSPSKVRDEKESDNLQRLTEEEAVPTSLSACKNHPLYAIEAQLTRYQVIYPKEPQSILGKLVVKSRQSGAIVEHSIYPRSLVKTVHSVDGWLKKNRSVLSKELAKPIKRIKASSLSSKDETLLYGEWQTQVFKPKPMVDGKVPKNSRGHIHVYDPQQVPIGCLHLPDVSPATAKLLDLDYARAMTGFEVKKRRSVPVFSGIVVCKEYADLLRSAEQQRSQHLAKKREEAAIRNSLKLWRKIFRPVLIRQRLIQNINERQIYLTQTHTSETPGKLLR